MRSSSVLLFDLGGVLVANVGFERLGELVRRPDPSIDLKARWLASPAVRAFELGQTTPAVFASTFTTEWDLACEPGVFLAEFASWPKGFHPGMEALLATLRKDHVIACLSNSNAIHWGRFDGFRDHFDIGLSSHLLGVIKPDAAAFERALIECGVTADAVRFFDDSRPNVDAARTIGMRAFHVVGPIALVACLRQAGLIR